MGNAMSDGKVPVDVKLREYKQISLNIPFKQLELIKVLQREFSYEVKGTFYVDNDHNFKSFEIRTDSNELYSSGGSDWQISFHTHPDSTAQKYGLRYYSPPSVDDVMDILDRCQEYAPDNVCGSLGEISIVFANEGIYLIQADRQRYVKEGYPIISDDDIEEMLHNEFNPLIVGFVKKKMEQLSDGKLDLENPKISREDYIQILKDMSDIVSRKFPFILKFFGWPELEAEGLNLEVNTYYVNKKVID
jgi:hypothetical protein